MTGTRRLLHAPEDYDSNGAAVLCNVTGCDHRACHVGPFQSAAPPVFIQDALYFMLYEYDDDDDDDKAAILEYDLVSNCLSLIDAPPLKTGLAGDVALMAMEDGSLGFAHVDGLTLNLWSRHMRSNGVASWPRRRVINLETLIPVRSPWEKLRLIGSVEGSDIIFVTTDLGIYEINLTSLQWKKLLKRKKYRALFPYMSFYNLPERILEIIAEFTPEQQHFFCQYVTGAPLSPPGGLSALNPKPTIGRKHSSTVVNTSNAAGAMESFQVAKQVDEGKADACVCTYMSETLANPQEEYCGNVKRKIVHEMRRLLSSMQCIDCAFRLSGHLFDPNDGGDPR
ncbi:hypothetical protein ACQ4PT_002583 [Festuca glaucescens]